MTVPSLEEIADNLSKLLTNSVNIVDKYYDMFFNETPMYINLQQYDSNGNLQTYTLPNRAMDKYTMPDDYADKDLSNLTATGNAKIIPNVTGQSNKFLTNDGSSVSWSDDVANLSLSNLDFTGNAKILPNMSGQSGKFLTTNGIESSWANAGALPDETTITYNSNSKIQASSLVGLTASTAELNVLDGITASTAELNYVDGVTSNIQTQLNNKVNKSGDTMTDNLRISTASNTRVDLKNTSYTNADTFSSNVTLGQLRVLGNDDAPFLYMGTSGRSNGVMRSYITARRNVGETNKDANIYLEIDSAGNPSCSINENTSIAGQLTITNANETISSRFSNINLTSTPDTTQWGGITLADKNGSRIGRLEISQDTNGITVTRLNSMRVVNGVNKYANVRLSVNASGTPYAYIDGETTIVGTLYTGATTIDTTSSTPLILKGKVSTSTADSYQDIQCLNTSNNRVGVIRFQDTGTVNRLSTSVIQRGTNTLKGGTVLSCDNDGNLTFNFPKCTTQPTTTSTASDAKVAVVVRNYLNGNNWYRKWSDGFIEQGGVVTSGTGGASSSGNTNISFNTNFALNSYTFVAVCNACTDDYSRFSSFNIISRSTSQVKGNTMWYNSGGAGQYALNVYWYACGY